MHVQFAVCDQADITASNRAEAPQHKASSESMTFGNHTYPTPENKLKLSQPLTFDSAEYDNKSKSTIVQDFDSASYIEQSVSQETLVVIEHNESFDEYQFNLLLSRDASLRSLQKNTRGPSTSTNSNENTSSRPEISTKCCDKCQCSNAAFLTSNLRQYDIRQVNQRIHRIQEQLTEYHNLLDLYEAAQFRISKLEDEARQYKKALNAQNLVKMRNQELEADVMNLKLELAQTRSREDWHTLHLRQVESEIDALKCTPSVMTNETSSKCGSERGVCFDHEPHSERMIRSFDTSSDVIPDESPKRAKSLIARHTVKRLESIRNNFSKWQEEHKNNRDEDDFKDEQSICTINALLSSDYMPYGSNHSSTPLSKMKSISNMKSTSNMEASCNSSILSDQKSETSSCARKRFNIFRRRNSLGPGKDGLPKDMMDEQDCDFRSRRSLGKRINPFRRRSSCSEGRASRRVSPCPIYQ